MLLLSACEGRSPKLVNHQATIHTTIADIYTLLREKKQTKKFNQQYIHPKHGLHVAYRLGAYDSTKKISKIDFKKLDNFPLYASLGHVNVMPRDVKWRDVTFDCMAEKWSDKGFFLHKVEKTTILNIDKTKETSKGQTIQKDLFKFVDTVNGLAFYLKYIDGRWYIVILDEISGNCDA